MHESVGSSAESTGAIDASSTKATETTGFRS